MIFYLVFGGAGRKYGGAAKFGLIL